MGCKWFGFFEIFLRFFFKKKRNCKGKEGRRREGTGRESYFDGWIDSQEGRRYVSQVANCKLCKGSELTEEEER